MLARLRDAVTECNSNLNHGATPEFGTRAPAPAETSDDPAATHVLVPDPGEFAREINHPKKAPPGPLLGAHFVRHLEWAGRLAQMILLHPAPWQSFVCLAGPTTAHRRWLHK